MIKLNKYFKLAASAAAAGQTATPGLGQPRDTVTATPAAYKE